MPNASILNPLKTLEKLWFRGVLRGCKMGTLAWNGLNKSISPSYSKVSIILRLFRLAFRETLVSDKKDKIFAAFL